MGKFKTVLLPILVSIFLIPLTSSFAQQEEEIMLYGTEEDDSVIYESGPVEEDAVLYDTEFEYEYDTSEISEETAAAIASVSIGIILASIVFGIGGYVFGALALSKIGQDMGYENPWFAWIPILNTVMVFHLGNQNPVLLLLLLIPGIGEVVVGVLSMIALMKITEKRGYDKMLALIVLTGIGAFILLYLLAWKPKNVENISQTPTAETPYAQ